MNTWHGPNYTANKRMESDAVKRRRRFTVLSGTGAAHARR
jgi:hypothetical protein